MKPHFPSLIVLSSALTLGLYMAPLNAQADTIPVVARSAAAITEGKAYSAFITGQMAASESDLDRALTAYNQLLPLEAKDTGFKDRAFLLSLLNGDLDMATRLDPGKKAQSATTKNLSLLLTTSRDLKYRPKDALKGINAMLALDPDLPVARLTLPLVLAQRGQIKKAIDPEFMGLADLEGSDPFLGFFLRQNMALLAETRPDEASQNLAKTFYEDLYSHSPAAMSLMGMDYAAYLERRGDIVGALKIYDALSGMGNEEARVRSGLVKQSKPAPPQRSFLAMTSATYMVAAQMAARDKEPEMALIYAHLSQMIDPTPDQRLFFLSDSQVKLKQSSKALISLAKLPKDHPRYIDSLLLRRQLIIDQAPENKPDSMAQSLLDEAHSLAPKSPSVVYEKAVSLLLEQQLSEGLIYLEGYLKEAGSEALGWNGYYLLASFYEKQNQWEKAIPLIEKAIKMAPDQAVILNFYGYGLINRNQEVKKGLELVEQALKNSPQNGAIIDSKAWGHYRLSENQLALEAIESAIVLEPVDPEITEHLGDIYQALGRYDEAGWAYERALGYLETDSAHKSIIHSKLNSLSAQKQTSPKPLSTKIVGRSPNSK